MKPNLGFYVQKINDIVKETEVIGETMNPYFEEVRQAIDNNTLTDLTSEKLTEIKENFETGSKEYEKLLGTITQLKPPARVIGIHKKLEKAYGSYIEGCFEMVGAISPDEVKIDVERFNNSEKKQDENTDTIAFCIQRMTNLLLK